MSEGGTLVHICADMHHSLNIRAHTRIYVVNLVDEHCQVDICPSYVSFLFCSSDRDRG